MGDSLPAFVSREPAGYRHLLRKARSRSNSETYSENNGESPQDTPQEEGPVQQTTWANPGWDGSAAAAGCEGFGSADASATPEWDAPDPSVL